MKWTFRGGVGGVKVEGFKIMLCNCFSNIGCLEQEVSQ